jgi:hypothetical protein|tara:strand:+ start:142 stop:318 length:177 start_codon:yes stop_codon:yes gene_type:complete
MHYDLKQDGNTGNWWVIRQDECGFREIIATLSADLTYSQAKIYMNNIIQTERMNVKNT